MICDKITSDTNCNTIVQNEGFDPNYVYIYILQLNKSDGSTICQTFFRTKGEEEIKFTIGQDGYYTLCKLKIPLDEESPYYYKDEKFIKNGTITSEEVTLQELLGVNPEVSGIGITYYYYFQICKLRKCYIDAANKVLNERTSIECNNRGINSEDIYKRDLLWSAINVLMYLSENEQFEEAERLLEKIMSCNGLCENESKSCGCGCGR